MAAAAVSSSSGEGRSVGTRKSGIPRSSKQKRPEQAVFALGEWVETKRGPGFVSHVFPPGSRKRVLYSVVHEHRQFAFLYSADEMWLPEEQNEGRVQSLQRAVQALANANLGITRRKVFRQLLERDLGDIRKRSP